MKTTKRLTRCIALVAIAVWPLGMAAAMNDDPRAVLGLTRYSPPTFPVLASSNGIFDGAVWVAVGWDQHGNARDVLVLRATHAAFARAVEESVMRWARAPGYSDPRANHFIVEFHTSGIVVSSSGSRLLPRNDLNFDPIPSREELDAPPHAIEQPMPSLAVAHAGQQRRGRVVVTFFVDEEGRVRAANMIEATSPEFAAATLAAMEQWRFQPAYRNGRPTIYGDRWAFDFKS